MQTEKEMTFGERVRSMRMTRGLTLREVEKRGGPAATSMSEIERDMRRAQAHTVLKIAKAIGVSPTELGPYNPASMPHGSRVEREMIAQMSESLADTAGGLQDRTDEELGALTVATENMRAKIRAEYLRRALEDVMQDRD